MFTKTRLPALTPNHQVPRLVGRALSTVYRWQENRHKLYWPKEKDVIPAPLQCRRAHCRPGKQRQNCRLNDQDGQGRGWLEADAKTTSDHRRQVVTVDGGRQAPKVGQRARHGRPLLFHTNTSNRESHREQTNAVKEAGQRDKARIKSRACKTHKLAQTMVDAWQGSCQIHTWVATYSVGHMSRYALGLPFPYFGHGGHAASSPRARLFPLPSRSFPIWYAYHCSAALFPFFCGCVSSNRMDELPELHRMHEIMV